MRNSAPPWNSCWGGGISFQRLGSGQQGDTAWTLIIYPGTDPDAAARSVYLDLDKVFAALPDDGVYSSGFAMAEMENGYAILVRANVDKAGTEDKPDPVTLKSIAVTTPPTKTTYWVGESFDPAGMVITATYSNNTTKTISDITTADKKGVSWTPDGALATSDTSITITYGGKTTTVSVTVKEPEVDSLTVEPSSLTYTAGDSFTLGDITKVTAGYTDGNDKEININDCDLTITPPNGDTPETVDKDYRFMTEGSYTLTVSFGGKDAQVNIEVNPATVTGIKVTTQPTRTTYFDGESFDPAGMTITATYSDDHTEPVENEDCTYSPETLTKDNTTVAITYGELETTVTVQILDGGNSYAAETKTYSIATAEGLQAWNQAALNDLSINCTLTSNIDLTGEWTPIGTESQPYTGTFDGNNYTITGLTVNQTRENVGLIGCIGSNGTVKNVKLENVNITGDGYFVGGVAGTNYGTIENCSVDGTLTNNRHYLGGVVGNNYGSIIGCSSSGTITGTSPNVGGIGGQSVGGTIMACYSVANIKGWSRSGGVLGQTNRETVVIACYHAKGNVTGEQSRMIGGVIGWNYGKVTACYWENNQEQGIGDNQGSTTIETTKVDGNVTWQTAYQTMNAALAEAGSKWRYNETTGTLIKP